MTVARIVAITALACAAIGMTTQAEAAKGKHPPGYIELKGCAYWGPLCGTFMGPGPNAYVLNAAVPWNTPITVFGRKTGNANLCGGQGTLVEVTGYAPNPKISCQFR